MDKLIFIIITFCLISCNDFKPEEMQEDNHVYEPDSGVNFIEYVNHKSTLVETPSNLNLKELYNVSLEFKKINGDLIPDMSKIKSIGFEYTNINFNSTSVQLNNVKSGSRLINVSLIFNDGSRYEQRAPISFNVP